MAVLLKFQNVSLFKQEAYGLSEISFKLERNRRYSIRTRSEEQSKTLTGLIEDRFRKDHGYIERAKNLFIQSDRGLLGDRVFAQTAGEWLSVQNEFFQFGGRKRSKFGFIQSLNARHLIDFPIYKLDQTRRTTFALLSLAFQERGIILIDRLLDLELNTEQQELLKRIVRDTHTTCCLVSSHPVQEIGRAHV